MSKSNSTLLNPDPLIMTPTDVNDEIVKFLEANEFYVKRGLTHSNPDIRAIKEDYELIIESRGNQAYKNKGTDKVFDSSQLDIHLSEHVTQSMRFQQNIKSEQKVIFIMANPNIPRIKNRVDKLTYGLDKLEVLRFWVNDHRNIAVEGPERIVSLFKNLLTK